jgi:hypothetical protein
MSCVRLFVESCVDLIVALGADVTFIGVTRESMEGESVFVILQGRVEYTLSTYVHVLHV